MVSFSHFFCTSFGVLLYFPALKSASRRYSRGERATILRVENKFSGVDLEVFLLRLGVEDPGQEAVEAFWGVVLCVAIEQQECGMRTQQLGAGFE